MTVYLAEPGLAQYSYHGRYETGTDGQFTVEGLEGRTYQVLAYGDKAVGGEKLPVSAPAPTIELLNDVDGVRLVLSLTGRPWDEQDKEQKK